MDEREKDVKCRCGNDGFIKLSGGKKYVIWRNDDPEGNFFFELHSPPEKELRCVICLHKGRGV